MSSTLYTPEKDPMGAAIADYYQKGKAGRLRVFSSQFDEDEIPVAQLFRTFDEMPALEQMALKLAQGKILDCGAGSGCHALALQDMGKDVHAIDISPLSVEVMQKRGVKQVHQINLFDEHYLERFDTILMLMNGSGIIGRLEGMERFFGRVDELLVPGGQVLMDSSDLRYVYEDEEGRMDWDAEWGYYGEVDYRMRYGRVEGLPFDWLYVDMETLSRCAADHGYSAELICLGSHYDYLARLTRKGF